MEQLLVFQWPLYVVILGHHFEASHHIRMSFYCPDLYIYMFCIYLEVRHVFLRCNIMPT